MSEKAPDTEARIKDAARAVFLELGYDGATIRRIAERADINLALVNYYFRSKDQLFKTIYQEKFMAFAAGMIQVVNEDSTLEEKIELIVGKYVDMFSENPQLPLFVLTHRPTALEFLKQVNMQEVFKRSALRRQLEEGMAEGRYRQIHPAHLIATIWGGTSFPVMAKPMIMLVTGFDETGYQAFLQERKQVLTDMVLGYLRKP